MAADRKFTTSWINENTPPRHIVLSLTLTSEEASILAQRLDDLNAKAQEMGRVLRLEATPITAEDYLTTLLLTALYRDAQ